MLDPDKKFERTGAMAETIKEKTLGEVVGHEEIKAFLYMS